MSNSDVLSLPTEAFNKVLIKTDGGARPNPGHGAAAAVLFTQDGLKQLGNKCIYLGLNISNNIAEHAAILLGLQTALLAGSKSVVVNSDSKLAVDHLNGMCIVQNKALTKYVIQIKKIECLFTEVIYQWVPRAFVKPAHYLVTQHLQNRADVIKKQNPIRKVALDLGLELYNRNIDFSIESGFVLTNKARFAILPFFTVNENREVVPSIDKISWYRIKSRAKADDTYLVWRPYGAKDTPHTLKAVSETIKGTCKDTNKQAPLMIIHFNKTKIGNTVNKKAFNGSDIHFINGGPFELVSEVLDTWN